MEKLLEMKEICKSFGTNNVLKNVQFDLFAGEVHALIGENGAGKSTLMKILMGMYKKDSGSLSVLGSDEAYTNPDQALKAGVAMIHQELNPIPDMSVAENIFLGKEKRKWIFTSKKEQEKESKRYLDMLGIDLEPSVLMRELSVSEMQMVEIAKALSYGARIIIMDEPTSAITEAEVEKLFQNIKMLKEQGTGIIYISHKMDELFEISDRITVLRDGQYVFSKKTKDLCPNDLIKAMVGREITEIYPESKSKIGEVRKRDDAGKYYDSCIGIQKGGKRMKVLSKNSVMEFVKKTAILWVMIILILILSVISPSFFRGQNLLNIIKQASITGVIGVGMTFVLITGGIDLSVGSVMALSGTMAASVAVAEKNMPIALVILVGVGLGALCGLINGIGVSYIGFPPFIMTLGMMTIARGIPLVFTNGTPIFGLSEEFNMIANSRVLGVPSLVIFLVITVLAGHIILSKTVLGRRIYAVGGNEDAARLSGVSTAKVKLFVYVFCGILSGIAGILICSRITSGNGTVAEGYEMNAISAAVIGGVSMTGGSGNVLGMVVGAMILTIIQNSFDIMGVNSFYQNIIKGIIILLAVFLDLRGKKKKN